MSAEFPCYQYHHRIFDPRPCQKNGRHARHPVEKMSFLVTQITIHKLFFLFFWCLPMCSDKENVSIPLAALCAPVIGEKKQSFKLRWIAYVSPEPCVSDWLNDRDKESNGWLSAKNEKEWKHIFAPSTNRYLPSVIIDNVRGAAICRKNTKTCVNKNYTRILPYEILKLKFRWITPGIFHISRITPGIWHFLSFWCIP